jgi:hypothetical protein
MKKTAMIFSLLFALCSAGLTLRADSAPSGDDTVTLKDGRILHGQVVEESDDNVVVLVQGVQRTFGRSFIKKIVYGSGPDEAAAPAPAAVQSAAPDDGNPYAAPQAAGSEPAPKGDMVSDLAQRYRVPVSDVIWVRKQGISDTDLPLVFLVAATAQVMPRAVVKLRLEGWAWDDIETHFGLNSEDIYYDEGPWGPYPYYYYPGWWGGWGWGWGGGGRWRGGWGGGGHYGGGHWGGGGRWH